MFEWLFKKLWSKKSVHKLPLTRLVAAPFTVHQGKRYRATVTLDWGEQLVASNDYIANMLAGYGFEKVVVTGAGAKRLAEGTWGRPDAAAPPDPHLSNVIEVV